MVINEECKQCQIRQNINKYPEYATQGEIKRYQDAVRNIIESCDGLSTPQIAEKMYSLRHEFWGADKEFSEIKRHFNDLMLASYPYMENKVRESEDHLRMAVQYAMVGNYIDFGALENVNEDELKNQLDGAASIPVDTEILENFRNEILKAHWKNIFQLSIKDNGLIAVPKCHRKGKT